MNSIASIGNTLRKITTEEKAALHLAAILTLDDAGFLSVSTVLQYHKRQLMKLNLSRKTKLETSEELRAIGISFRNKGDAISRSIAACLDEVAFDFCASAGSKQIDAAKTPPAHAAEVEAALAHSLTHGHVPLPAFAVGQQTSKGGWTAKND